MAKKNWLGKMVRVEWSDAFTDNEVHPENLTEEYIWNTYGKVIRQTSDYITVASDEGGKGKDQQVSATTVLMCMVIEITEYTEVK